MNVQDTIYTRQILQQPRATNDAVIWKASPNGAYTVNSAYKMCLSLLEQHVNYQVFGDWWLI